MVSQKIRVMIVDDSLFFREYMARSLSVDPFIEVIDMASDAFEAQQKIMRLQPDVITLDIEMPKMRGTNFLRWLRPKYPDIHVVVISSVSSNVFEALHAGAVEFVLKPNTQLNMDREGFIRETVKKIKIAAASTPSAPRTTPAATPAAPARPPEPAAPVRRLNTSGIIAIGASTGGTEAILSVLKELPANAPGVVVVQHMPPVFTKLYAERLDKMCKLNVKEAEDGDRIKPGLALIAPGGERQMRVVRDTLGMYVRLEAGEKVSGHCPSVDVLFESVAQCAGRDAIGVILTGMGADGAKNLGAMRRAGAHTIGQDQQSCVVYGMPMVAYNSGAVAEQLPLGSIAGAIIRRLPH